MGFFTPFEMPTGAAIPARQVSVADFGAVPGGQVNNTRAFAAAIDHLAALGGPILVVHGRECSSPCLEGYRAARDFA